MRESSKGSLVDKMSSEQSSVSHLRLAFHRGATSEEVVQDFTAFVLDQLHDELVEELSVEHLVEAKLLLTCAMIGYPVIRPVVRPYLLTEVTGTFLVFTDLLFLGELFLTVHLVELLSQCVKCGLLILWLLSKLLRNAQDTGGHVSGTARTVGLVHVLAASPLCPHKVQADFFHVHSELAGHHRHHDDDRRA